METYVAIDGQSLADICLNTYGSMDYFYKLLQDSNVSSANQVPFTGQLFYWDRTLVIDAQILSTTTLGDIRYATFPGANGNTYFIITNPPIVPTNPNNNGTPNTPTMYQKTSATSFTAIVDETSVITLTALQGKQILQIERNIQPLLTTEYSWNSTTGVLTLVNPMYVDEKLFILYTEMVTI